MKTKTIAVSLGASCLVALGLALAMAADKGTTALHRYLVERTFPAGAIDGLDADKKHEVNETNARFGVRWQFSYATPDKTKTYCVYLGPSEEAVRAAAAANHLPVDSITEVPVTVDSE